MSRSHYILVFDQIISDLVQLFTKNPRQKASIFLLLTMTTTDATKRWCNTESELFTIIKDVANLYTNTTTNDLKLNHGDLLPTLQLLDNASESVIFSKNCEVSARDVYVIHKFIDLIYFDRDADILDVDIYIDLSKAMNVSHTPTAAATIIDIILLNNLFKDHNQLMIFMLIKFMTSCRHEVYLCNGKQFDAYLNDESLTDIKNMISITNRYKEIIKLFHLTNFSSM